MTPISFAEPPPPQGGPATGFLKKNYEIQAQKQEPSTTSTPKNTSNFPVVALDVDVLTDTIAARLAASLLGHVLFLKNQIPLPVVQLARLPTSGKNTKALKMRTELLSSYDTLASHLVTTFTSLSTALAKGSSGQDKSRAYLAILTGPNVGIAKSKVIYGVDSFATRVWGQRDQDAQGCDDSGDEFPQDSEDEDPSDDAEDEGSDPENIEDNGEVSDFAEEEGDDDGEDEHQEESGDGEEEDSESDKEEEEDNEEDKVPPRESYAEEQRFLQAADRLLSRTLASADAEGHGIANEMSPTQTHILIRAPRRFVHPSWIPRQNITRQMEQAYTEFLKESWPSDGNRPLSKKSKTEGVWITGRSGLRDPPPQDDTTTVLEGDEMIWWSWDGKLVGFADW